MRGLSVNPAREEVPFWHFPVEVHCSKQAHTPVGDVCHSGTKPCFEQPYFGCSAIANKLALRVRDMKTTAFKTNSKNMFPFCLLVVLSFKSVVGWLVARL